MVHKVSFIYEIRVAMFQQCLFSFEFRIPGTRHCYINILTLLSTAMRMLRSHLVFCQNWYFVSLLTMYWKKNKLLVLDNFIALNMQIKFAVVNVLHKSAKGWLWPVAFQITRRLLRRNCLCRSSLGFPFPVFISALCLGTFSLLLQPASYPCAPEWEGKWQYWPQLPLGMEPRTHCSEQPLGLSWGDNLHSPYRLLNLSDSRFLSCLTSPSLFWAKLLLSCWLMRQEEYGGSRGPWERSQWGRWHCYQGSSCFRTRAEISQSFNHLEAAQVCTGWIVARPLWESL